MLCSHRHCFRNLPIAPNERRAQEVAAGLSLPRPARQPRGPLPLSLAPRICLFQVRPARGLARCLIVRVWRPWDVGVRPCRGVCRRFAPRQGGTASPCPPRSWRVPVARWRALRLFPPFLTLAFFFLSPKNVFLLSLPNPFSLIGTQNLPRGISGEVRQRGCG